MMKLLIVLLNQIPGFRQVVELQTTEGNIDIRYKQDYFGKVASSEYVHTQTQYVY